MTSTILTSQMLKRMAPPITKLLMTTKQLVTETVCGSKSTASSASKSIGMTETVRAAAVGSVFFLRFSLTDGPAPDFVVDVVVVVVVVVVAVAFLSSD